MFRRAEYGPEERPAWRLASPLPLSRYPCRYHGFPFYTRGWNMKSVVYSKVVPSRFRDRVRRRAERHSLEQVRQGRHRPHRVSVVPLRAIGLVQNASNIKWTWPSTVAPIGVIVLSRIAHRMEGREPPRVDASTHRTGQGGPTYDISSGSGEHRRN